MKELAMGKKFWTSKTLWTNAIALVAMALQQSFGVQLSPEAQMYILAGVNIILRFVTKEPLDWRLGAAALKSVLLALAFAGTLVLAAGVGMLGLASCAISQIAVKTPEGYTCQASHKSFWRSYEGISMNACGGNGEATGAATDQRLNQALTGALIRGLEANGQ